MKKNILIYTPQIDGHYMEYIHHLYECEKKGEYNYIFLIPKDFESKKGLLKWSCQNNVSFVYLTDEECRLSQINNRKKFYYGAKILTSYIKRYKVDEALVLTLTYVMPFIWLFLLGNYKCKISGIIYSLYPYNWKSISFLNKVRTLITYYLFSRSNTFKDVFILNSLSCSRFLNTKFKTNKFKYLTDPVQDISVKAMNIRKELKFENNNKIILHFGAMSRVKGSLEILKALESAGDRLNNYNFVFAGVVSAAIKKDFYNIYNRINHSNIRLYDKFCSYQFVNNLLYTCDAILIPYVNSGQSSGVVAHGALFRKPLIVLRHGFVGKLVRYNRLGICLKDNAPETIIEGLLSLENYTYSDNNYIKSHTVEEFCIQIFRNE